MLYDYYYLILIAIVLNYSAALNYCPWRRPVRKSIDGFRTIIYEAVVYVIGHVRHQRKICSIIIARVFSPMSGFLPIFLILTVSNCLPLHLYRLSPAKLVLNLPVMILCHSEWVIFRILNLAQWMDLSVFLVMKINFRLRKSKRKLVKKRSTESIFQTI